MPCTEAGVPAFCPLRLHSFRFRVLFVVVVRSLSVDIFFAGHLDRLFDAWRCGAAIYELSKDEENILL